MIFQNPITAVESIPFELRQHVFRPFSSAVNHLFLSLRQSVVFRMTNQMMAINLKLANLCSLLWGVAGRK